VKKKDEKNPIIALIITYKHNISKLQAYKKSLVSKKTND